MSAAAIVIVVEQHIDRICREVAGKPDAALRLFVAAGCVAPVLDGEAS